MEIVSKASPGNPTVVNSEENIVEVTPERLAEALGWMTPERWAALDALTDDEITAQIASNPDACPELDEAWLRERAS